MRPDACAVVFDLDDTLYPYRRFQVSGFDAVARHLAERVGLDRRLGFRAMHRASRGASRGREVQACLSHYDLAPTLAPELVDLLRHHEPHLRLPVVVTRVLESLRRDGWRLGVLTNGRPSIQARKVEALGLRTFVDAIVYAATCGAGEGKPDPEAFAETLRQLGVPADRAVFVGNDERTDVAGSQDAGMRAIRCRTWVRSTEATRADAVADTFRDIPTLARLLVQEVIPCHAA